MVSAVFVILTLAWCTSQSFRPSTQISNSTANSSNTSNTSSVSSPEQFVENYYLAINNQEYLSAWNRLSSRFQAKKSVMPNGYNSYLKWWETVERVEINQVNPVSKSNEAAQIDIQLQYFMKSGRRVSQNLRLWLLWNTKNEAWVIDDTKRL